MGNNLSFELLIGVILLTPLLSFVLSLLIPERYSWLGAMLASACTLISALGSLYIFFLHPVDKTILIQLNWFQVNEFVVNANIEINRLAILMLPVVTVVSFLIHLYSIGYMAGENSTRRYFAMLGFFTFSMLGIILSDNLIMIFMFWELVGFSSYMLIGHWMQKPEAASAAKKAFIFNRIGDAGFLVGIMIIWANTQTFNLTDILTISEIASWQTAASLCIFLGVVGKSAQFPLFTWLPDAMEGPTPVSALIHAATMVAAGVFLLARLFPLFTNDALHVVAITGTGTALLAAFCALNQFDIKKILAYSTISQLGLMVAAVGAGSENAAMLHLFSHAFFKACLFLGAGSIIHALHQAQQQEHTNFDLQDIRNLGGLRKKLPDTFLMFVIASSSLAGVPFFSGFISKDSIMTTMWNWTGDGFSWKWLILISILFTSFITVLYTFRMVWYIFFSEERKSISSVVESPLIMRIAMLILSLASFWWIISPSPIHVSAWFTNLIGAVPHSYTIMILSAGIALSGIVYGWLLYVVKSRALSANSFMQEAFKLDAVYKKTITTPALKLADISETTDRKWIDGVLHFTAYAQVSIAHGIAWFDLYIIDGLVNAFAWIARLMGSITRSVQGGKIQLYIFWAVLGLIIFLFFLLI